MRRLGMKSKRAKSETSGSESEENGGDIGDIDNSNDEAATGAIAKNNNNASESDAAPATRKTALKRRPRGAAQQKPAAAHADDGAEATTVESTEPEQRENGEKKDVMKPSPNKRKKKEDQKASTSSRDKNAVDENEYEVEKIVGHRTIKGRRQFLVRWKDYNASSDSWENEKDLNCPNLIEEFLINEQENKMTTKDNKETKMAKTKSSKIDKSKKSKGNAKKQSEDGKNDKDKESLKEFEVERIIEVHFKKKGTREFLIRWKGFSAADDTWEPEENLNCPDLIAKFMQKLEKVKTADVRELRTNPAHTKRYTLTTHDSGRRLSRRHMDKQRATYHECDE